ncbi:ESPR-type extended signal peptide-containing protein [Morganella morganii]
MNRIFNVIWSSVLKCMIVVSELSGNKSRIQSQVNNANYFTANKNKYFLLSVTCSAVLLGLAGISDVSAATLNVPVYTPEANSELQG